MNPLTNVKNLQKINERELELGLVGKKSWHDKYKDSAWIFIGGLPYDLTEGDVICVFSQYGEIVNINLVRDKKTGKIKGYGFLCYEDQRSTVLAVDNFNGAKILGRTLRVDHVENYKQPKEFGDEDEITKQIRSDGCAPKLSQESEEEEDLVLPIKKAKKEKKTKKQKKEKKKKKHKKSSSSSDSGEELVIIKKEKPDPDDRFQRSNRYHGHLEERNERGHYPRDSNVKSGDRKTERDNDIRNRDSDRYRNSYDRKYDRDSHSKRDYQSNGRGDNSRDYRRDRSQSPNDREYQRQRVRSPSDRAYRRDRSRSPYDRNNKRQRDQSDSPPRRGERTRDR